MDSVSSPEPLQSVAEFLGLGSLADDAVGMDPETLKALYRHARGEDGKRQLFEGDTTFAKGWVDLDSPRARELVSTFVALDDTDNLKQARRIAQNNIESQPWNDVLGIESPLIKCVVKIHGRKWALRFQSAMPGLRGRELLNEQLPPIPDDATALAASAPSQNNVVSESVAGQQLTKTLSAARTLQKGGLPS